MPTYRSTFMSTARAAILATALAASFSSGCDDDPDQANIPDGSADAGGQADAAGGNTDAAGGVDTAVAADAANSTDTGAPPPPDLDIALVRFNADGTLDTTFGTGGVARVDFGPGAGTVRDSLWGLARDAQNRLVLFGSAKGAGTRVDTDRVVMRLTANGAVDTTFATMGKHTLNIANLNDQARHGIVQADGKIVASGYTSQPTGVGTQSANRVVLLRLDDAGKPDPTFGVGGVVNSAPFVPADPAKTEWGMAEAYGAVWQSGKYVTTGYGRSAPSGTVDMVSFRYTAEGALDTTWGMNGIVTVDLVGENDRGRNLVVLPGDRVLVLGSGTPMMSNIDALAIVLGPNGALDNTFDGDGRKLYDFGRPDEAFFGAAVSPSGKWAAGAGYRAGAAGGVMEDDDATLLLLPLDPAAGAEVAKAVPLSETANDRFWTVTFDAMDRVYAAGFVNEGGDSRMVVARYTTAGALDTTFGMGGIVQQNVVMAGGTDETARGVVVQSDGKVVVAGVIEVR